MPVNTGTLTAVSDRDDASSAERAAATTASRNPDGTLRNVVLATACGVALIIVGAFGPWVRHVLGSVSGLDGDGVITLLAGLVATGVLFRARRSPLTRGALATVVLCALLTAAVAIYHLVDISNLNADADAGPFAELARVFPGWGLYMTLVGAGAAAIGGGMLLNETRLPAPSPAMTTPDVAHAVDPVRAADAAPRLWPTPGPEPRAAPAPGDEGDAEDAGARND